MATKAFVTDWDNIARFVMDTAALQAIPNATREYLKGRLISEEDHIVLITLSVLDSFVVNCGRAVRDELSSPAWMKILLNSFVTNLPKKHIRNAIQQMFSNWRGLVPDELLGQEARNVCKHMQSKNYVVPTAMEYSPAAVAAVATGQPTTSFVRGFDFYVLVYGTVNEESDHDVDQAASTSTAVPRAHQPLPHAHSGPSTGPSTAALRAMTGPATDTADVKLVRMQQDCKRLTNATQACRETSAACLRQHDGVDGRLQREGERCIAYGLECAAQCRSWSDAVQKMVHEGVSESLLNRTLEVHGVMCATLDAWEEVYSNLARQLGEQQQQQQQQQQDAVHDAHNHGDARQDAHRGDAPHSISTNTSPRIQDAIQDTDDYLPNQGSGNPFAPSSHPITNISSSPPDPIVSSPHMPAHQRKPSNNPFSSTSDLASLDVASTSAVMPSSDAAQAAANAALHEQVSTLRNMLDALKVQHTKELAAAQAEVDHSMEAMRLHSLKTESLLSAMTARAQQAESRAETLQQTLQEAQDARDALEMQLRQLDKTVASQQRQVEQLQAQLQSTQRIAHPPPPTHPTPATRPAETRTTHRVHSAVEWSMLAGKQGHDIIHSDMVHASGGRALAHTDSLSAASNKGGIPQGADASALLAAYRRMPCLRVRFTPTHFASLVTTVLDPA